MISTKAKNANKGKLVISFTPYFKVTLSSMQNHLTYDVILTVSGSEDQYYLLCDVLAEDKTLREFLQKKKLVSCLNRCYMTV